MIYVFLQPAEDEAPVPSAFPHTNIPQSPAIHEPELMPVAESRQGLQDQTFDFGVVTPSEDEFVHGALCK